MFVKIVLEAVLAACLVSLAARGSSGAGREHRYRVHATDTLWSIAVAHYVDDGRNSRRQRALARGRQLVRLLHVLAVAAERLAHAVVARLRERRGDLRPGAVEADLRVPDLAPGGVVADDEDDGEPVADERLELEAVEPEGAVARD